MGEIKKPLPVKLFFACTYNSSFDIDSFYNFLISKFNIITQKSIVLDYKNYTKYYNKEMGSDLKKQIISIKGLYDHDEILKLKIYTNKIEDKYSSENKRIINIDPGYLTEAKVVLFTTKNNIHRIYIGNGLYAEVTLSYRKGRFSINQMTYPDYKEKIFLDFFEDVRKEYKIEKQNNNIQYQIITMD